ncbi:phosphatidylglycerol lysyltransferase domain-containing protein [uncultured Pseudacidovorax sp.]|uniref:phosphatidylglycerol lysyltransferase domain-containing protein n=1 Tax=uncultured Pseudacidovorax sp. TaxID=679313 RepID=UPI0025F8F02A|nr:phosphatidylglycerol lysyltransferase domain-containing protein [uncultured Pseudacidovorax sp.]
MTGLPITLDMQPRIDAALAALRAGQGAQALSDHAFSNLYLFREAHAYRFLPGEWPGVAGRTYDGATHVMPLFDIGTAPLAVLDALIERHGCLYPVAEHQVRALPAGRFACSANDDDADYLYAAESFRDYAGRALAKKRNLVRQFLAHHVPEAVPFGSALEAPAREVLAGWMVQKGKDAGEADEHACLEAIAHAARFGLEGFVYFVQSQPAAFVLAQALEPGVFAIRFAKGLDSHVGIYPLMFQHFCRSFARPVVWLNFEQDMGNPGFRRSKRSYAPQGLLAKWRVSRVG